MRHIWDSPGNITVIWLFYFLSCLKTPDDFKVDIMDMHTMESTDFGSLFGTGKDEQRTSPEAPG